MPSFYSSPSVRILTNSVLTYDTAGNGGGLLNVNDASNGKATITGSSFTFDTTTNGYGGGIDNAATLSVDSSHFSNDSAAFGGGGIFTNGMATIASGDFSNDTTDGKGGGIFCSPVSGTTTITNKVWFSENQAAQAAQVGAQKGSNSFFIDDDNAFCTYTSQ